MRARQRAKFQPLLKVGFTGTEFPNRLTRLQKAKFRSLLILLDPAEFHHGDCVEADALADQIAAELHIPILLHPPIKGKKRAFTHNYIYKFPPDTYPSRNKKIVDCTDILTSMPGELEEVRRSGTWMTIRYAREVSKPIAIIFPDGRVAFENGGRAFI